MALVGIISASRRLWADPKPLCLLRCTDFVWYAPVYSRLLHRSVRTPVQHAQGRRIYRFSCGAFLVVPFRSGISTMLLSVTSNVLT